MKTRVLVNRGGSGAARRPCRRGAVLRERGDAFDVAERAVRRPARIVREARDDHVDCVGSSAVTAPSTRPARAFSTSGNVVPGPDLAVVPRARAPTS
jgi:hypothetical protein